MSPLKLPSPSRSRFRRSNSLPSQNGFSDSPTPKGQPPEDRLVSPDWEEPAQDQLEIQALASSTLQAAATGCFYITPKPIKPRLTDARSPQSPNSPLPPFWNGPIDRESDSPRDLERPESTPSQIPKDELVTGRQYRVIWWDSRNAGSITRGRVEKFLFLDPLSLAQQLRELSSSEPSFIEGGPHHLTNLVDVFWSMACNLCAQGTVLPSPEAGYCAVCFDEMGRHSCYNPFHAKALPHWWREMQEFWDGVFARAREDGRAVNCMFFCGKMGCLNPVACVFRHDEQARRKICLETGKIRRRATFGSTWMGDLGLPGMF